MFSLWNILKHLHFIQLLHHFVSLVFLPFACTLQGWRKQNESDQVSRQEFICLMNYSWGTCVPWCCCTFFTAAVNTGCSNLCIKCKCNHCGPQERDYEFYCTFVALATEFVTVNAPFSPLASFLAKSKCWLGFSLTSQEPTPSWQKMPSEHTCCYTDLCWCCRH